MIYRLLLIALLLLTGCDDTNTSVIQDEINATGIVEQNTTDQTNTEANSTLLPKADQVVTIYIHGYNKTGYKREGVYGEADYDDVIDKVVEFSGLPTMFDYNSDFSNIIAITPYYGDTPPAYYSDEDIQDIGLITQTYGGGIPRYALIVAKFAKYAMQETGATRVNIVSGSMGSLVARWMIEKNYENLSSDKKIERWLSIEGVIRGNYALSSANFMNVASDFFEQSVDTEHMTYDWIETNLSPSRTQGLSPYYKDILIGQMSGTDSETDMIGLNYLLGLNGGFIPNDGYQLLHDTYFEEMADDAKFYDLDPTHSIFHINHTAIGDDDGAHAAIATFLESNKRVKITLVRTTVEDIHETTNIFSRDAEIVFESRVYSPAANLRWEIDDPISERVYDSGALSIYGYEKDGETMFLSQTIFDDFVLESEERLVVEMEGFEIDRSTIYEVNEIFLGSNKESLGSTEIELPIENGSYEIGADDWHGYLLVEVTEYPFAD